MKGTGDVGSVKIALGAMADRPMRAKAAEAALAGAKLTEEGVAKAVAAVGEGTSPITDRELAARVDECHCIIAGAPAPSSAALGAAPAPSC